jgi:hypothetical protein
MKQRITTEQLQELTDEQRDKLRELWEPQEGDQFIYCSDKPKGKHSAKGIVYFYYTKDNFDRILCHHPGKHNEWRYSNTCLPLLSIGQCIEMSLKKGALDDYPTLKGELIDALWDKLKEVL